MRGAKNRTVSNYIIYIIPLFRKKSRANEYFYEYIHFSIKKAPLKRGKINFLFDNSCGVCSSEIYVFIGETEEIRIKLCIEAFSAAANQYFQWISQASLSNRSSTVHLDQRAAEGSRFLCGDTHKVAFHGVCK